MGSYSFSSCSCSCSSSIEGVGLLPVRMIVSASNQHATVKTRLAPTVEDEHEHEHEDEGSARAHSSRQAPERFQLLILTGRKLHDQRIPFGVKPAQQSNQMVIAGSSATGSAGILRVPNMKKDARTTSRISSRIMLDDHSKTVPAADLYHRFGAHPVRISNRSPVNHLVIIL
jgi:hypothetical protein